jgi:hypothetical protein
MDKKKQIGILVICLLTCIIGVVLVSAGKDVSTTSDTLYFEYQYYGQPERDFIIDLEGYKTLHITYKFSQPLGEVDFSWCTETGYRVYVFFELPADGNTQTFTIKSRYLRF